MSDENKVALLDEPTGDPEELLKDIKDQQGQLKEDGSPQEPAPAKDAPEPQESIVSPSADKPPEEEPASGSGEAPVPFAEDDKAETEEWMKKKGFKDVQAMASSLRNLERKLHERPPSQPAEQPPQAPAQPVPAPASYGAQPNVEAIAKQYGVDPDDLQRIGRISNDIAAYEVQRQMRPLMGEIRRLRQENEKRSTYDHVQSDPTFNDPTVLREMHEIIDANPSVTKSNPRWMQSVHNMALSNLGRRYLEKGIRPEPAPVSSGKGPTKPPPSKGGSGQARGGSPLRPRSEELTPEQFAKLPAAEMEKYLRKRGAIPADY